MATRNVVLTDQQEELLASLVASGRFESASDVLRAGLRLVERDEREFEARLTALREAAQVGWDDFEAGRYFEVRSAADEKAVRDQIHARVDAIKKARSAQ